MNFLRDQYSIIIFLLLFAGYQAANHTGENEGPYTQNDDKEPSLDDYRLPKTIIPTHYEVILSPKLEQSTFNGVVHIKAYVAKPTDRITLHIGKIEKLRITVTSGTQALSIKNYAQNNKTEKYAIVLSEVLNVGTNVMISINYNGTLRDDMIGFYKSSYVDSDGKIRHLVSTQFQTTHARHAFPCFDEPSFKASFIIRLFRSGEYASLSNMPLNKTIQIGDMYWDEFHQSIPMSTYLVAFIISDFRSIKVDNFKVWARPNAIDQTHYALSIGTQGLKYLSKRFKQDYQISKMDMVAVPDFSAGAMENWGLVTYRESRLLYAEDYTSDLAKQSIASVIVHELTHMWFGNMITPEWWSYLWLSEAFARYFQYFGTAQIENTWNMEEQFVVEQHQTAYAADGIETSEPMTRDVSNASQVSRVGDTITYNKGASIVRMMNLIFGSEVFDAGLQNYLNNTEKKVARPENLWTELQNEINRNGMKLGASVKAIMTTWTEQPGFPVLSVSIENNVATLKQERFLLRNLKSTPTNITWWLPLTWTTKANPDFDRINVEHWMSKERETIDLGKPSGWVIFNIQSSGFYRVNYDNASWYRIIEALNSKDYQNVHVLNRAAIVDDLLNLARAGLLEYETTLDGLLYLMREDNYLPFKSLFSGFTYLDQRLSGNDEYYKEFKKFVLILIHDIYKKIGYTDHSSDDRLTVLLRNELNKWACNYGHEGCVKTFTNMFQQWRQRNVTIAPNQHPVAYCMGVKHGTKEDWEFLWNEYYNSNSATQQIVILQALGCTENTALLEKYLLYALKSFEESRIRMQDNSAVFSAVSGSGVAGAEFVLDFVEKHLAEMVKFYNGTGTISSILSSAAQRFSTQILMDKFESLIEKHKVELSSALDSLRNSLEIGKYELDWSTKYAKQIISWIINFNEKHWTNDSINDKDNSEYRLPLNITPKSYSIRVATNVSELDNFTFTGMVKINAVVATKTKRIILHSANLVHNNIFVLVENKNVTISKTDVNKTYDFLIIDLDQELQANENLTITIEFTGYLNEEMRGFYRSSYIDSYGQTRWLAATHMEPVGARKMFPCFDEPAMKAKFTMTAVLPLNYSAISNMQIKTQNDANEQRTIVFQETPTMSTYLVVLVVSDFIRVNEDNYSVWARKNAINNGKYALSVMKPLVNFYEQALNISYQLPKLDMVALPDFVSGAMENWGLLTYKERNVLYDSALSTTASKQSIINVISHEITHQWFGNLVSPQWWKYLWLNEGFARYFQYFGTKSIEKDWSLEAQFVVEQLHSALEADSAASTHAMTHDVYSPTEIRGIFDSISYAKAASVIRMMEKIFGSDVFYKALQNYLKKRQYNVATPTDLFDAFKEEISNKEIANSIHEIMNSWSAQPGYPVVNVVMRGNSLELKQERFFLNTQNASTYIWHIPITWTNLNNPNFEYIIVSYWFNESHSTVQLPSNDLYVINLQQSGFYRVNYDAQTWERIIDFLKSDRYKLIHEINRATLIDDLLNLGKAGRVNYSIVLSAMQYLRNETNYIPWRAFFNGLTYLQKQFEERDGYGAFVRYIKSLLEPLYSKLGFDENENDDHVTKLFKSYVRKWACKFDIGDCKSKALFYFNSWNDNDKALPPNIRGVTYCTAVEEYSGGTWNGSAWRRLWDLYSQSNFAAEKSIILQSLACTTERHLLEELLDKAVSKDSGIRLEDSSSVFTYVMNASPDGVQCVINFVKNNYDKMVEYYKQESNVRSIVNSVGKKVFTNEIYKQYIELLSFLDERRPTQQSTFNAKANNADQELKWANVHVPKIYEWLERNYPAIDYRLPKTFSPLRYNIFLSPHFEKDFKFDGSVQIEMKRAANYVSRIVVHAHELDINSLSVYEKNSNSSEKSELKVSSTEQNKETQMLSIFLENFVQSDMVDLYINFTGTLNDNMEGFYRSYYTNSAGEIRWLATTQLAPIHARQVFPCFDEPNLKATFVINIERPKDYIALSNMPRVSVNKSDTPDREWDTFNETVEMSTYLVAFVISDFKNVDIESDIKIWGRPDIALTGDYAQNAATQILYSLPSVTGHKYMLPKLDLVGIPDFSMGAMENWGLVTFREYGLFYEKDITSDTQKDYITTIIAHELSHMLFGNLVTCDWWEYIWLNEGFAEYMQYRLSHAIQPNSGFLNLFVVDELQAAMQADVSETTHPMNNPVAKPAEIKSVFDSIAYAKSASVIRMLDGSFKPEISTKAIYNYLLKNQFKATTPKNLWDAFDNAIKETNSSGMSNVSVATLMDGWVNKAGYPVVSATLKDDTVTLTQKSFRTYENIDDFWIPITLSTASEIDFSTTWTDRWLKGEPIKMKLKNPNEWYIVNVQQTGYYRVNYDKESWLRLIKTLKNNRNAIHPTNRAQIIDDLFNLARAGYVDYQLALNGTLFLKKETEHVPWKAFVNGMNFILQRYEGQKGQDLVWKYVRKLSTELYKQLDITDTENEDHTRRLNRNLILNWLCRLDHEDCLFKSVKIFRLWQTNSMNAISPNARQAIYCTAIRMGTSDHWHFLWQQYLKTNSPTEKKNIINALGCAMDKDMLTMYIGFALDRNYTSAIRKQDVNAVFASIYNAGGFGVNVMLDVLIKDYTKLHDYYGNWHNVKELIQKLAPRLSTKDQISKLSALNIKGDDQVNITMAIHEAVKTASKNLEWYEKYSDTINAWMSNMDKSGGVTLVVNRLLIIPMTVFSIIVYMFSR
ncbi:unnamed protein product [Xylocopa violacea]|uniref:Aminopeptidase-2 n=1 Tax=Xylocopa violacea TaxID=135666 RepID=A0ABP1N7T3_XYLVO